MNPMRRLSIVLIFAALALGPLGASADDHDARPIVVAQNNGKTLSEAVEQVRRQTGGRILSAETKVSGGREVHHIKVLTKDGKVKTHKVQGRKRGG
ncbi:MAG: hypothetical protein QNI96_08460 [Woeseiaceae bacterium]|nr:hypothetical protein [Woeseiaceae bacterium]